MDGRGRHLIGSYSGGVPMGYAEVAGRSPLGDGPFRWRMGLRRLGVGEWLQHDDRRAEDLSEKWRLWGAHRNEVFVAEPTSRGAAESAAAHIDRAMAADGFASTAELVPASVGHPLARAALAVQEDLCLLQRRTDRWLMTAAVVCFPTRWDVRSKLGRSVTAIHGPVPGFDGGLTARVDRSLDGLSPERLAHWLNWSVVADPARRLVNARQAPTELPADPSSELHFRLERQTLRRLADHEAIVFGIRVHSWPLGEVLDQLPPERLAIALETMPAAVAVYKDLDGFGPPLVDWLRHRAAEMAG
jgi:hypothetical protein